ncbi:MAG: hypothetical protein HY040_26495 [Planctomycetes bacterium]|nr:hypothetical protein [Planctomycetota bacterium]
MTRRLACFLLFAWAQPALAQTRLEWKFAEGDSFALERIYTQKQIIDVNGKTFTQETTSKWLTTVAVSEKNARTAVLLLTIDGVSIKTNGPGLTGGVDEKLAEKMKGQSLTVTLTPHGRITRLEGYDTFVKKLAENKADVEKTLRALLSEESLRDGLEEIFGFLPDRAVAKGDKWKRTATEAAPPFGALKSVFEYVYEGEKDDEHIVSHGVKMTYQPASAGAGTGADVFKVLKGNLKSAEGGGNFAFNAQKGRLIRGEKSLKMQGDILIESLGKQSQVEFRAEHELRIRVLDNRVLDNRVLDNRVLDNRVLDKK